MIVIKEGIVMLIAIMAGIHLLSMGIVTKIIYVGKLCSLFWARSMVNKLGIHSNTHRLVELVSLSCPTQFICKNILSDIELRYKFCAFRTNRYQVFSFHELSYVRKSNQWKISDLASLKIGQLSFEQYDEIW